MINQNFLRRFGPVIEAWNNKKFPAIMLERIDKRTSDLSDREMGEVCDLLLDNCEHAPTVAKVVEFASLVRNRRDRKPEQVQDTLNCAICGDLGTICAVSRHDDFETLVRCSCPAGEGSGWALPKWARDFNPLFEPRRCPKNWFIPARPPEFSDTPEGMRALKDLIWQQIPYWRTKIRIAEEYWASNIAAAGMVTAMPEGEEA